MNSPITRFAVAGLAAALFFAAATNAGEELMPLAPPGGVGKDAARGGTDKPALPANVIKLTLPPVMHPDVAAKLAKTEPEPAPDTVAGKAAAGTSLFLPPPPVDTAAKSAAPAPMPAPAAAFSPIDHMADIPGLMTPDLIAKDRHGPALYATTFPASRDALLDLVPMDAPTPESLSISPALPEMPVYKDTGITTLEPFAIQPPRAKPRPEQIHLPPPIASEAGFAFPGFGPPIPAEAMPATPTTKLVLPTEHLVNAPVKPPEAARPSKVLSLRPPPDSATKPAVSVAPPPVNSSSPLLTAPLGLTLTASVPSLSPGLMYSDTASMPRTRSSAMTEGRPSPSSAHRHAPPPARKPVPSRQAPSLAERTLPKAEPGDEQGFTMMRSIKNILGP